MTRAFERPVPEFEQRVAPASTAALSRTVLASLMPGGMLWAWIARPIPSDTTREASARVSLRRPGLRFCGIAEET